MAASLAESSGAGLTRVYRLRDHGPTMISATRWDMLARWAPGVLLLLLLVQAGLAVREQSLTWDEGDHLYSGYCNWVNGEYTLNPEHPPLAKLVAALPLLPLHLKLAPRHGRYFKTEAYWGGSEMIFRNGSYSADTVLLRARLAMLVFSAGLALMLFSAGREMFGKWVGLIAMCLYVFDTTVLAHAPLVTTDTAGSCGFFAAVYALYRFVKRPGPGRLLVAGLAAGFALVSKHSAVLLLPMVIVLLTGEIIARAWSRQKGFAWGEAGETESSTVRGTARGSLGSDLLRMSGAFAALVLLAVAVMWAVYGFRFALHPNGVLLPAVEPLAATLGKVRGGVILWLLHHRILPESYLYGLVDVFQVGDLQPGYLFGKVSEHGVWYFFPVVLSMKWTLAFLLLLPIGMYALLTGRVGRKREVWFLSVPVVIYLVTAMSSPLAIGVRHVLPLFAFVFLLAAAGAAALAVRNRVWAYVVAALLLWHAADSLRMYPNYFPYSNALWGGPTKTWHYVADSTVDWGQQLKAVKHYTDAHHIQHCYFAYFVAPFVTPRDYGVPCDLLPTLDTFFTRTPVAVPPLVSGPVFLNTSDLDGYEFGTAALNPYQGLVGRQPDELIGGGIVLFNGTFQFPLARAMNAEIRSETLLATSPAQALTAAQEALTIVPEGFTANLDAGDAFAALGRKSEALASYHAAQAVADTRMEPSGRVYWTGELAKKAAAVR